MAFKTLIIFLLLMPLLSNGEDCETFNSQKHFGDWIDADYDGENTLVEVLLQESLTHVKYRSDLKKIGDGGSWYSLFSGKVLFDPQKLDVVTVVPLREAYESGAWKWNQNTRARFKNFLKNKGHLIVVGAGDADKRQGKDISEWLPKNKSGREVYALMWVKAKREFRLTADAKEIKALKKILKGHQGVEYPDLLDEVECFN